MNVAFYQVEQHKEAAGVKPDYENCYGGKCRSEKDTASFSGNIRWDSSSSVVGDQAYRDQKDKTGGLLEEVSAYDAKNAKNFMVVMSNTLSDEDYGKILEKGGNPGDYEPGEMVTIIDEIKVTLAKAGVYIAGYTDNVDENAVREVLGDNCCAEAIARALKSKDLPVTEKNIKDCYNEIEKAAQITELSEGAKKYLLENGLEPTIDSLYKAAHVGAKDSSVQPSGYFGTGTGGYLARKGNPEELSAMEDQMKKIISQAGLNVSEDTLEQARWLLEKGLPLTEENLFRLQELNGITFPMGAEEAALAAADALSAGLSAKEANPAIGDGYRSPERGYIQKAREINEKTQALTEQDLARAMEKGKTLTLFQLFQLGNQAADQTETVVSEANKIQQEPQWINAKKQLLEIQLHMSAQANLKLMKQGIHIELEPLDRLLKLLEKEESIYHATELAKVGEKTEEIKSMPAATIGVSAKEAWMMKGVFTLQRVYETGKSLTLAYAKAGESYEALMTAPRADLGDSMKEAFRNVDELLKEVSLSVTEDNRRAVRILGYNRMEITRENIDAVKEGDAMLQKVLSSLTPEKTLRLIREGVNPLEMNLEELLDYLAEYTTETEELEKYSRYLYRLEQNGEIDAAEKDAYIGIYRLLRQIEKGDRAAIGTVIANQQELNLENLLSAVRTRQKRYVDAKIDDAFGLLTDMEKNGVSITDQIYNYYKNRAGKLADDLSATPQGENPTPAERETEIGAEGFSRTGEVSEACFHRLLADDIPVTANRLLAEEALSSRGSFFAELFKTAKGGEKEKSFLKKAERMKEAMSEGEESVQEAYADMAKTAGEIAAEAAKESGSYIDVRSMAFCLRQIDLAAGHAKKENYYVPVQFEGEWTMLHVQIVNGKEQGKVSVDYKGDPKGKGRAGATFVVKGNQVEGLICVSMEEDLEKYTEIAGKCAETILAETGKEADISCIQSKTVNLDTFMATDSREKRASTRMLYQVAKAFIHTMEQEVATK